MAPKNSTQVDNVSRWLTQARSALSVIGSPENVEASSDEVISGSLWLISEQLERIEGEFKELVKDIKSSRGKGADHE
ncbi:MULTISPECIES: hypothetical protein [Vibrio]|uniref:hypothetical protein n=1 Tax=Vibrio TaxID=662 RepID=UPI00056F5F3D|nr:MULTISPECIES: hypothetical protein [Vibrio]EKO3494791.1 hypothetical protein [Vibrio fluvialis]MBL4306931.1 hypothetical protein [Vibrio fluvialis]QDC92707.1 hypothetical protein FIU11_08265 [Vibrio furnissii]UON48663.1 hypothetical protein IUJ52_02755 [Vibrio furnissii]SUP44934.1 Uncharacterised protein [Vibrio furnissii]